MAPAPAVRMRLPSSGATLALGRAIGRVLDESDVIALVGEVGAGKTTLVKGIASGIQSKTMVTSPTFVLIHEYQGRVPLVHMDLYRLRNEEEAEGLGLQEYFSGGVAVVAEWADRFPAVLPHDRLEVRLTHRSPTVRLADLSASGMQSRALLRRITMSRRRRTGRARPR